MQFPELLTLEVETAIVHLTQMMETPSGKDDPHNLLLGWLGSLQVGKYGPEFNEMLSVRPMPGVKN